MAVGQKMDAERQLKKDDIEHSRLVRLKKIPRPATRAERDAQEDQQSD
jgi:ribosome biogenesis GTPase A